jgi:hypothetical protein
MASSVRHRILAFCGLPAVCLSAWFAPAAAAEFGPIQLVSKTSQEQAGFAREAAISADGEYVAFFGELSGLTGIFRKNLTTGALALVVEGAAEAPSISADGRYVSFTTKQMLDPVADTEPQSNDVYVADLAASPLSYELASSVEGHRMAESSSAAPRVALSGDGSEVAFVNQGQVYVHVRGEAEPILITVKKGSTEPEPVAGGGAYEKAGAALSADGNAVAWVGENLPEQVPLLPAEEQKIQTIEPGNRYLEPLWRLVPTAGQTTSTRRIVGGGDPLAPGCLGDSAEPACQGPFPKLVEDHGSRGFLAEFEGFGWGNNLPQLSADGSTVAVIGSPEDVNDLFVVNMEAGLSRVQAVRQLTRWTDPMPKEAGRLVPESLFEHPEFLLNTAPIKQCAISPDGKRIAFTTQRQVFPLAPPNLITARPTSLPTVVELYQVDLEGQTIERVTPGPGTEVSTVSAGGFETAGAQIIANAPYGEAESGASGPSYGDEGRVIAFASSAYNLIEGDANENSDVFTVESKPPSPVQQSTISSRPSVISVRPVWKLSVHAVSQPNGAVRIIAGVPGAGTLGVRAKSRVGGKLALRKVGQAQRRAPAAGAVRLELKLPHKLRNLARQKGGLYTALNVQFAGPGGKVLKQQLVARFRVHAKAKPKKGKVG